MEFIKKISSFFSVLPPLMCECDQFVSAFIGLKDIVNIIHAYVHEVFKDREYHRLFGLRVERHGNHSSSYTWAQPGNFLKKSKQIQYSTRIGLVHDFNQLFLQVTCVFNKQLWWMNYKINQYQIRNHGCRILDFLRNLKPDDLIEKQLSAPEYAHINATRIDFIALLKKWGGRHSHCLN